MPYIVVDAFNVGMRKSTNISESVVGVEGHKIELFN